MFTHRRKNIGEAKVGLTKHHSRVPPFIEKLRIWHCLIAASCADELIISFRGHFQQREGKSGPAFEMAHQVADAAPHTAFW